MADDRLRELERRWKETGDHEAASALDQACRRAGVLSMPREAVQAALLSTLKRALFDAFDPAHLLSPCCGHPVRVGHASVHNFRQSRPLFCPGCTFSRRTPEREYRLGTPRARLLGEIHYTGYDPGVTADAPPLHIQQGGRLVPGAMAPWPTKLLAKILQDSFVRTPNYPVVLYHGELLSQPLGRARSPLEPCPLCGWSGYVPGPEHDPHSIQPCPRPHCPYARIVFQAQEAHGGTDPSSVSLGSTGAAPPSQ